MQQKLDTCRVNHLAEIWFLINQVISDLYSNLNCFSLCKNWLADRQPLFRIHSSTKVASVNIFILFTCHGCENELLPWKLRNILPYTIETFRHFLFLLRITGLSYESTLTVHFKIFSLGPKDPIRQTFYILFKCL